MLYCGVGYWFNGLAILFIVVCSVNLVCADWLPFICFVCLGGLFDLGWFVAYYFVVSGVWIFAFEC